MSAPRSHASALRPWKRTNAVSVVATDERRQRGGEARRHVDAHVRELVLGQELPSCRSRCLLSTHSRLRSSTAIGHAPPRPRSHARWSRAFAPGHEVRREREHERAELAELAHRLHRREQAVERARASAPGGRRRRPAGARARAGDSRSRTSGAIDSIGTGVVRQEAVGAHVDGPRLGRAVDPRRRRARSVSGSRPASASRTRNWLARSHHLGRRDRRSPIRIAGSPWHAAPPPAPSPPCRRHRHHRRRRPVGRPCRHRHRPRGGDGPAGGFSRAARDGSRLGSAHAVGR